ncbi:MAG TPA: type II secretion system protein [Candidatus Dormibacteraeota bacterium]|nr:type II secretion system protein [Candidatus Dormibacteraeota bacterium]
MKPTRRANLQSGYTLVEVIIALAIGALLMVALTSVIFSAVRASAVATSRVQASAEIRNFEYYAYDDFARSQAPSSGVCTQASPCTTQALTLTGIQVSNTTPQPHTVTVSYIWDGTSNLDRSVGGGGPSRHTATDVTAFDWYVDANSTVVVSISVTVGTYTETSTFRFYPRMSP